MKKVLFFLMFLILLSGCEKKEMFTQFTSVEALEAFAKEHRIAYELQYAYSEEVLEGEILKQEPESGVVGDTKKIILTVSLGSKSMVYRQYLVNELGEVPIMMYHGIVSDRLAQFGGNVDRDGYQRTSEAFVQDLEFYYQSGYRMVRLVDFIEGNIDVALGKSPIVLTFDDGLENNCLVTGRDENGSILIDPNSAVGILESFKQKYPDYQVTATFFLNGGLFGQPEYNEEIIQWLIAHGYDIGNHSYHHVDFTKVDMEEASLEIGKMYHLLSSITSSFVPILALPYGSPYSYDHPNFDSMVHSSYEGVTYDTVSTLRVGWESNVSPYDKQFDALFLKRIRAYDHGGTEFDIQYCFQVLERTRYISDGDPDWVVVPSYLQDQVSEQIKKVVVYEPT